MLITPFGSIKITFDRKEIPYTVIPVSNPKVFPDVDGAYILETAYSPDSAEHELHCFLDGIRVNGAIESGERLEAISYHVNGGKITIGCEASFGDPETYNYDYDGNYTADGLKIWIAGHAKKRQFRFGVAWLNNCTAENDIQTWFAADPTYTVD